nr:hypothetical protein JVH1_7027 [Rhodococcus sp. JVH1]
MLSAAAVALGLAAAPASAAPETAQSAPVAYVDHIDKIDDRQWEVFVYSTSMDRVIGTALRAARRRDPRPGPPEGGGVSTPDATRARPSTGLTPVPTAWSPT